MQDDGWMIHCISQKKLESSVSEQTELLRRFRHNIYGKPKLARCCLTASKQESIHMQQLLNTSHVLTVY